MKSLLFLLLFPYLVLANFLPHSVQVQWCVSCEGDLRIWLEHWHGFEDPNSTTMTISVNVNGVINTITSSPGGSLNGVTPDQLTGCTTPLTYEIGCPGEQNNWNDWVYYDFPGLPVNVPLSFTIISGNTVFTEDGCGMYPLTVDFTIPIIDLSDIDVCSGQLTQPIIMDNNATWTNSNPSIGLPESGTGTIPAFNYNQNASSATITYINNCSTGTFDFNILPSTNSTTLVSDINSYNLSCNGSSDGFINLDVSGGVPPFTYVWSNGETTQNINNLSSGTYSVTIISDNGCEETLTTILNEPSILLSSETHSNYSGYGVSCYGAFDGYIDLTVSGGVPPYTYTWSNGAITEDLNSLSQGSYSVSITDQNGCQTSINNIEITQPSELTVSGITSDYSGYGVSCFNGTDGSINLTVSGGAPPYNYIWSNGESTQDIFNLSPGYYTIQVIDLNNCMRELNFFIDEPFPLQINYGFFNSECEFNNGSINVTVSGGTPPYIYSWSNGATTQDIDMLSPSDYYLNVTDSYNCESNIFVEIIDLTPPPALTGTDQYNCELSTTLFASTIDDNSGPWEYVGNLSGVTISDPYSLSPTVSVPSYGEYTFQYSACNNINTISVFFTCPPAIPNVLTLNSDGNNDLFVIQNINPEIHSQSILTILNRWGNVIYRDPFYGLANDKEWWDGTTIFSNSPFSSISPDRDIDANKKRVVSDGVYYYILDLYFRNRTFKKTYKGYVQVLN